jgi:hypothetical protein
MSLVLGSSVLDAGWLLNGMVPFWGHIRADDWRLGVAAAKNRAFFTIKKSTESRLRKQGISLAVARPF